MKFNSQLSCVNSTNVWVIDHDTYIVDYGVTAIGVVRSQNNIVVFDFSTALITKGDFKCYEAIEPSSEKAQVCLHSAISELCGAVAAPANTIEWKTDVTTETRVKIIELVNSIEKLFVVDELIA